MQELITLIDKASQLCGGDTALAKRIGVHQPDISAMRHGKRSISPATAAELADMIGEDAREAVISAVIESAKGTRREGVLREILGKALAAGVAGVSGFSYREDSIFSTLSSETTPGKSHHSEPAIHRIKYEWLRTAMNSIANPTRQNYRFFMSLVDRLHGAAFRPIVQPSA